ncbi:MAG: pyridoxamine 5'-phosphate oxidase [Gammaproteobacteria bacterium]|nr:pyridoxamine 5'-phosphate oxidase [Gammaproteobacteria bacterium]
MNGFPESLPADPLPVFADWFAVACADSGLPNPEAMALATSGPQGQPAVRIVLCKDIVTAPGYLVFYTNYESDKAQAIAENAAVAVNFHWDVLNRQVRIEGLAVRSPAGESDAYFASRDRDSQLGAWASRQSAAIGSRAALQQAMEDMRRRFGTDPVPRPPHWGGYRIWIHSVELWARGTARLHDRARWQRGLEQTREAGEFRVTPWSVTRLQP